MSNIKRLRPGPNDAQIAMGEGLLLGTICTECGEDIDPGQPCAACADKREILRQGFPALHGDS